MVFCLQAARGGGAGALARGKHRSADHAVRQRNKDAALPLVGEYGEQEQRMGRGVFTWTARAMISTPRGQGRVPLDCTSIIIKLYGARVLDG